ncbi:MAG: hypothetical protein H6R12_2367 [Proteobacteria bacterium]|nr:hypothetical protein [Pseudomonadota bacterium]
MPSIATVHSCGGWSLVAGAGVLGAGGAAAGLAMRLPSTASTTDSLRSRISRM